MGVKRLRLVKTLSAPKGAVLLFLFAVTFFLFGPPLPHGAHFASPPPSPPPPSYRVPLHDPPPPVRRRSPVAAPPPAKARDVVGCLRVAFRRAGANASLHLHSAEVGGGVATARAALLAAASPDDGDEWVRERLRDGVPFALLRVAPSRGAAWAPAAALAAARTCFDAHLVVYADLDTLIYWPEAVHTGEALAPPLGHPLSVRGTPTAMRTNVMLYRPHAPAAAEVLSMWLAAARNSDMKQALSTLYNAEDRWFHNHVRLLANKKFLSFELHWCGFSSDRGVHNSCMANMRKWSEDARRRMNANAVFW